MSCAAGLIADPCRRDDHRGPVQASIRRSLGELTTSSVATTIALRSPLGEHALCLRPEAGSNAGVSTACKILADRLSRQQWVAAAVCRAPHIYVMPRIEALRSWIGNGLADCRFPLGAEGQGRTVVIASPTPAQTVGGALGACREVVIRDAIAALLRSRSYLVVQQSIPLSAPLPSHQLVEVALTSRMAAAGHGRRLNGSGLFLAVGDVDVPHGRLRARNGGAITADDLLEEITGWLRAASAPPRSIGHPRSGVNNGLAEAALAYLLLRTDRCRHIELREEMAREEVSRFAAIATWGDDLSDEHARPHTAGYLSPRRDGLVRSLVFELDSLPWVAARAAHDHEPALVARYLRSLGQRLQSMERWLSPTDPLLAVTLHVIAVAGALIGLTIFAPGHRRARATRTAASDAPTYVQESTGSRP